MKKIFYLIGTIIFCNSYGQIKIQEAGFLSPVSYKSEEEQYQQYCKL